jgi:hypothetical protein
MNCGIFYCSQLLLHILRKRRRATEREGIRNVNIDV